MRLVQHRTLGLWKRETVGTSLHRMALQATEIKFIVQKGPVWLEVPRGAESEMPTAARLCGSFAMSPQRRKVWPKLHYSIKIPTKMVRE